MPKTAFDRDPFSSSKLSRSDSVVISGDMVTWKVIQNTESVKVSEGSVKSSVKVRKMATARYSDKNQQSYINIYICMYIYIYV